MKGASIMFKKKLIKDYKTSSQARDDFFRDVENVLTEKRIECGRRTLYDLVDAYSESDTETMSKIFLDILKKV